MKVVPGSNGNPAPVQQAYPLQTGQQQPSYINDPNIRPVFKRVDSRGQFPFQPRQPGPYPNQQTQQPVPQGTVLQGSVRPPPLRPQPSGGYIAQRPPLSQTPRFPTPISQQRHAAPENITQNNPEYRPRPINPTEFPQRISAPQRPPPPPGQISTAPRGPAITSQKPPGSVPQSPVSGSFDQSYKRSFTLDQTDNSSFDETNKDRPYLSQIKNQAFRQSKTDITSSDQYRSSSSLGVAQDPEKDIDTSGLNGKTSNHEEMAERSDSRSGLYKEQALHSSMHKIDEDEDDLVVKPSFKGSGTIRSISGSSENITQKLNSTNTLSSQDSTKQSFNIDNRNKTQDVQPQLIKYPQPKPNVIPDVKSPYSQVSNTGLYYTDSPKMESIDSNKYRSNQEGEYKQQYGNDNDVVIAPARYSDSQRLSGFPPQKPNMLPTNGTKSSDVIMSKTYQTPVDDTWANVNVKSGGIIKNAIPQTTRSDKNYNRQTMSARYRKSGAFYLL